MNQDPLQSHFDDQIEALVGRGTAPLGLSVSGGGDSIALLYLAANWAVRSKRDVFALTIDHGLRDAAAAEARLVADACVTLGVPHQIRRWTGWDGKGNLMDRARRARHSLIDSWRGEIDLIATGHTRDDQAETFLMNLARGSGVDGLAAMEQFQQIVATDPEPFEVVDGTAPTGRVERGGFTLIRPLLNVSRQALRDYLRERSVTWIDDPSNEDPRFARVRARSILSALEPLDVDAAQIAETAAGLRRASIALDTQTRAAAQAIARTERGDILFDLSGYEVLPAEIRHRLLSAALCWISSTSYRPRLDALLRMNAAIQKRQTATLHGCVSISEGNQVRLYREPNAVAHLTATPGTEALWDNRWHLKALPDQKTQVRALGVDGAREIAQFTRDIPGRKSLAASPALWADDALIAAPLANFGPPVEATFHPPPGHFATL